MGSPFDSGRTLIFKSMSTAGSKRYLDSSPSASLDESVYLLDSIDFTENPGTHWESIRQADGSYLLRSMSTRGGSNKLILDSSARAPLNGSVYLADNTAGGGSHWKPTLLADGSYSLESQTPSGPKRFMNANPTANQEASVYLVENSNAIGTHWMVGVDYYTIGEISQIVTNAYPAAAIDFHLSDRNYGSLDYEILHGIWNDSGLDNYRWKEHKFDCDDFSVLMKAAVAKYSYNQTLPDDKGSLCGIIFGSRTNANNVVERHAFNFTIDPFGNLILFEPQSGQQIARGTWTPYFCMV